MLRFQEVVAPSKSQGTNGALVCEAPPPATVRPDACDPRMLLASSLTHGLVLGVDGTRAALPHRSGSPAGPVSARMKLSDDGVLGVGVIGAGRIGLVHLEAAAWHGWKPR